jgi:tryptophan synthase alpha subunit
MTGGSVQFGCGVAVGVGTGVAVGCGVGEAVGAIDGVTVGSARVTLPAEQAAMNEATRAIETERINEGTLL